MGRRGPDRPAECTWHAETMGRALTSPRGAQTAHSAHCVPHTCFKRNACFYTGVWPCCRARSHAPDTRSLPPFIHTAALSHARHAHLRQRAHSYPPSHVYIFFTRMLSQGSLGKFPLDRTISPLGDRRAQRLAARWRRLFASTSRDAIRAGRKGALFPRPLNIPGQSTLAHLPRSFLPRIGRATTTKMERLVRTSSCTIRGGKRRASARN